MRYGGHLALVATFLYTGYWGIVIFYLKSMCHCD